MAKKRKLSHKQIGAVLLSLAGILLAAACFLFFAPEGGGAASTPEAGRELDIYMLDVGQADALLVRCEGKTMMIDAGGNKTAGNVVKTLQNMGIGRIDILIGTHPHEDHVGGLDAVIDAFDIGTLIMPKAQAKTKTFEDVLDAIERKGLTVTTPKIGDVYRLGSAEITILSPQDKEYRELNNTSVVCRLVYGSRAAVFCGDAELPAEQEMKAAGRTLKADILKVGHHGASSSTSKSFFDAVNPSVALISCGADNTYGHPHEETMKLLNDARATVYRTDLMGTVHLRISPSGEISLVEVGENG